MKSTRLALLVLPVLAACEEEPPPTLDCEGEEYAYYFYERDAVEADSACLEATVDVAQVMESPDIEGDEVQILVSANKLDDVAQSPRICALALTFGEVPVEGAGRFCCDQRREGGAHYTSSSDGVPRVQFTGPQPAADGGASVSRRCSARSP